jgi:hypothetical protein
MGGADAGGVDACGAGEGGLEKPLEAPGTEEGGVEGMASSGRSVSFTGDKLACLGPG